MHEILEFVMIPENFVLRVESRNNLIILSRMFVKSCVIGSPARPKINLVFVNLEQLVLEIDFID